MRRILALFMVVIMMMSLPGVTALADEDQDIVLAEDSEVISEEETAGEEDVSESGTEETQAGSETEGLASETEMEETQAEFETEGSVSESVTEGTGLVSETEAETEMLAENADASAVSNGETKLETEETEQAVIVSESAAEETENEEAKYQTEYETEASSDDGIMLAATTYTSGYWTYTLSDSNATITGYTGSSKSISIPSTVGGYTVTGIASGAFEDSTMTSLVIPKTVTTIGTCAFKNCKNLKSITINATNLSALSSGAGNQYYYNYSVFYNAGASSSSLTVTFGSSVTCIPAYLFATGGDQSDGTYAHITSVTIPDSVTSIGSGAFENCYDLSTVSWGSGIQTIGEYAFEDTAITSVVIPSGTSSLGNCAFKNCTNLSSITINAQNISSMSSGSTGSYYYNYSAFYDAGADSSSLAVTFGSTVKEIPAYLFATNADYNYGDGYYAHITSVTIPSSVTVIGSYAFYKCYDLETVTIAGSNITFGDEAFGSCSSTLTFVCPADGTVASYASSNGYKTTYSSVSLGKPIISKAKNVTKGIKLKGQKVSNASGYYIYRKTSSGSYKKIKTITSASTVTYTDTSVKNKNGTKYTYKIVAYSGSTVSSGATKTIYRLKSVSLSGLTNSSSKKIRVKWSSTTKVTGYQIQYSTSKTFKSGKKTIKVAGKSKKSYVLTGLTKGKTYYVRIRTYKKVSGKTYYSAWSKKKSVTVTR